MIWGPGEKWIVDIAIEKNLYTNSVGPDLAKCLTKVETKGS